MNPFVSVVPGSSSHQSGIRDFADRLTQYGFATRADFAGMY